MRVAFMHAFVFQTHRIENKFRCMESQAIKINLCIHDLYYNEFC